MSTMSTVVVWECVLATWSMLPSDSEDYAFGWRSQ